MRSSRRARASVCVCVCVCVCYFLSSGKAYFDIKGKATTVTGDTLQQLQSLCQTELLIFINKKTQFRVFWNPNVYYRVYKSPKLKPITNQTKKKLLSLISASKLHSHLRPVLSRSCTLVNQNFVADLIFPLQLSNLRIIIMRLILSENLFDYYATTQTHSVKSGNATTTHARQGITLRGTV